MDKISSPVDALVNKNPEGPAVISVWGYIYNINKYHAAYGEQSSCNHVYSSRNSDPKAVF